MNQKHTLLLLTFFIFLLFGIASCGSDDDCNVLCYNGGILTIDCTCVCPEGYSGASCQIEENTCTIVCENSGTVTSDCTCDCDAGFTGEFCDQCTPNIFFLAKADYWNSAGGVLYTNDHEITLPDRYVLTGLGFNSSQTLMLKGREFNSDGTLGDVSEFRDGSNPSGSLAALYTVPEGHVITGVGFGIGTIPRLVVNYNKILISETCTVSLGPELLYDNNASSSVDRWIKVSDSSYSTSFHAFGGLGINYSGSGQQVKTEIREIRHF